MPTADEFDALGRRLRHHADALRSLATDLATTPVALATAISTSEPLAGTCGTAAHQLARAADRVDTMATTCAERAAVCRRFTLELARYQRDVADPAIRRDPATYPTRPPWARAG